ncbi:MAG: hypothetical protein ACLTL5_07460 [Oscillospiraceae bacterium]
MKSEMFTIVENRPLTSAVFEMTLEGDTSEIRRPGQFVELQLPGLFLRRPISVCTWDAERLTLLYKVVGQGTGEMAGMPAGTRLNLLTGLGNGYDLAPAGESPLLLGGGVGVPPLYGLCQALVARGKQPAVVLGFNTQGEVFYEDRFRALGASVGGVPDHGTRHSICGGDGLWPLQSDCGRGPASVAGPEGRMR